MMKQVNGDSIDLLRDMMNKIDHTTLVLTLPSFYSAPSVAMVGAAPWHLGSHESRTLASLARRVNYSAGDTDAILDQ